jgi:hypothetical protein
VKEWNATLVRGRRVIRKRSYSSESKKLKGFLAEAQSGDRLVVEILDVRRRTFTQTIEKVTIPTSIFSIPIQ